MKMFWIALFLWVMAVGVAWAQTKPSPTLTKVPSEDAVKVSNRVDAAKAEWIKKKVLAQEAEARMSADKELLTTLTLEMRALDVIIAGAQDALDTIDGTAVDISKPIRTPTPTMGVAKDGTD